MVRPRPANIDHRYVNDEPEAEVARIPSVVTGIPSRSSRHLAPRAGTFAEDFSGIALCKISISATLVRVKIASSPPIFRYQGPRDVGLT